MESSTKNEKKINLRIEDNVGILLLNSLKTNHGPLNF